MVRIHVVSNTFPREPPMTQHMKTNNGLALAQRHEPRFRDLLEDPTMQLLMARDDLTKLVGVVRRQLIARRQQRAA